MKLGRALVILSLLYAVGTLFDLWLNELSGGVIASRVVIFLVLLFWGLKRIDKASKAKEPKQD